MPFPSKKLVIAIVVSLLAGITTPLPATANPPTSIWTAVNETAPFTSVFYDEELKRFLAATRDGLIYESEGGLDVWELFSETSINANGITYCQGKYVTVSSVVNEENAPFTFVDLNGNSDTTAYDQASGLRQDWQSVTCWRNGSERLVAVANTGTGNRVATSEDGIFWTSGISAADKNWKSVTHGIGKTVAVASEPTTDSVMISNNGFEWDIQTAAAALNWTSVTFGNGLFVAVASNGTDKQVMTSPDGEVWTLRATPSTQNWTSVTYGNNGYFVAVASSGGPGNNVMISPDGINWTIQQSIGSQAWSSVAAGNGRVVAVSSVSEEPASIMTTDFETFDCDPEEIGASGTYRVDGFGVAFDGSCNAGRLVLDESVRSIAKRAFDDLDLTSVVIPEGVNSIGKEAFEYNLLTSVVIPAGVTTIGESAFEFNLNLSTVEIPASVISIGPGAFRDNWGLTSVTFGTNSQLLSIGEEAFRATESLESITIPSNVTTIEAGAFRESALTSIRIPANVTTIEDRVFAESELISITIPSSVTSIGDAAFFRSALTSIIIPSSVTSIGESVFMEATDLESVTFGPNSQLVSISDQAFFGATSLTSITIPSRVRYIENFTFQGATALKTVFFSENSQLETIGESAFEGATSLISIDLPVGLISIGPYAFDSAGLTSITIPSGLQSIGNYAFDNASSLSNFYFIGDEPYVDCGYSPFENGAVSAKAFVQPTANGYIPDESDIWCGLTVDRAGFIPPRPLYRNWQTPLSEISNGPKVGETVYASAFERELPRSLFKQNGLDGDFQTDEILFPSPEEYVYRITKTPNDPATSVDHQTHMAYESLTSEEQSDWYDDGGFGGPDYRFSWHAFMCVLEENNIPVATKPTGLTYSYASREDGILSDGSLNAAHNLLFKDAAQDWIERGEGSVQTALSVVGTRHNDGGYTQAFLGESAGVWDSYVWGLLEISASCGAGETFKALRIAKDQNSPITTKNFAITETLYLVDEVNNIFESIPSEGITIGVTGGALLPKSFNAALWGLSTIADSSTPPAPPSGGGGSSTQTPTPTPSATSSPRATQSPNPIIQNRLVIPTQLKPGTTNNPEPLIKKLIEDVSNSLKPIIVNIFTQKSPTPNALFDSKRALEIATPSRDKKVVELPSLVRVDNELQSSKLVVIDNSTVQVVTEGGGMLSVEAKDGVGTIPVDNTGKVQMIRSNTVNTNGVGLLPNSEFAVYLFSEPTLLGIGKSDLKGNFYASFMVDKDFPLGNHTLQVNGILSNGKTYSISMPVTVVENADIAHSQATPKSNLVDENIVTKSNNVSYLIIAIFILLLIIMLFGGSRLFLAAGRRRQED